MESVNIFVRQQEVITQLFWENVSNNNNYDYDFWLKLEGATTDFKTFFDCLSHPE